MGIFGKILPRASNNTLTILEDKSVTFKLSNFKFSNDNKKDLQQQIKLSDFEGKGSFRLYSDSTHYTTVTSETIITKNDIVAGRLKFIPGANENGLLYSKFSYSISTGSGFSSPATMSINVKPVDDAPQAFVNNIGINKGQTHVLSLADFKSIDVDGDPIRQIKITKTDINKSFQYYDVKAKVWKSVPTNKTFTTDDLSKGYVRYVSQDGDVLQKGVFEFKVLTTRLWSNVGKMIFDHNPNVTVTLDSNVKEDSKSYAEGQILITDPNVGDAHNFAAQTLQGIYGQLQVFANGRVAYTLQNDHANVQALNADSRVTDAFTVTTADGIVTRTIVITVSGTNDAPDVKQTTETINKEAPVLIGAVQVAGVDIDNGDTCTATLANGSGNFGTLVMNSDGSYRYNLDTNSNAVKSLGVGSSLVETFAYTVTDNQGASSVSTLIITINGTNAPASIGGDFGGTIAEDANPTTLTVTGKLTITDPDPDQNAFTPTTLVGTNGTIILATDGNWNYTADNTSTSIQQLRADQSVVDSFTVYSVDGTAQVIRITITGTNDQATIGGTSTAVLHEDIDVSSGLLKTSGGLTITDIDNEQARFITQSATSGSYGTFSLNANGNWGYQASNASVDSLRAGDSVVDSFTVTSVDNSATQTVAITIQGSNDPAMFYGTYTGSVTEDNANSSGYLTAQGSFTLIDPDTNQSAFLTQSGGTGNYGSFTFSPSGSTATWSYAADNSQSAIQRLAAGDFRLDTFTVTTVDGTTKTIVISLYGVNDAPIVTADSNSITQGVSSVSGNVLSNDSDIDNEANNILTASIGNGSSSYGTLALNTDGSYTYSLLNGSNAVKQIALGDTRLDTFTYTATDFHGATSTSTLTITITGINDTPVAVNDSASITQGDAYKTVNILSNDYDFDTTDTITASVLNLDGFYGSLTYQSNGVYHYNLNNTMDLVKALPYGATVTDGFYYTVQDNHGAYSTGQLIITITGINDTPVANPDSASILQTDSAVSGNALLNDTDIDTSSTLYAELANGGTFASGAYGRLTLNTNGDYTYSFYENKNVVNSLAEGSTLLEVFNYTTKDNLLAESNSTITITIAGTNDIPTIAGASTGSVKEDTNVSGGNLLSSGTLTITDIDSGQASFVAQGSTSGSYGTFTLTSGGAWTYTASNSQTAVQQLGSGQSIVDSFTATSQDGTATRVVSVTINGTNDAPIATADTNSIVQGDAPITGNVLSNDSDIDQGDILTASLPSGTGTSNYGSLQLNTDGSYTYTLNSNSSYLKAIPNGQTIIDTFSYFATDKFGASTSGSLTITVISTNAQSGPVLSDVNSSVTYAENSINSSPALIDSNVTLTASSFANGSLTVGYAAGGGAEDQLSIRNIGSGTGQIGVSGTTVSYEGTAIGTITSSGSNGINLIINFNSSVTNVAAVEALLEAIQYQNTSNNPTSARTISFSLIDSNSQASNAVNTIINVTPEADNLTLTSGVDIFVTGSENDTFNSTIANLNPTDVINAGAGYDSLNINGGGTITLTSSYTLSNLEIINLSSGANYSFVLSSGYTGVSNINGSALGGSNNLMVDGTSASQAVTVTCGAGTDTISLGNYNDNVTISLVNLTTSDVLNGGAGTDTLMLTGGGSLTLTSSFNGRLTLLESLNLASGFSYSLTLGSGYTALTNINANLLGSVNSLTLNASAMTTAVTATAGAGNDSITLGSGNDNVVISLSNLTTADFIDASAGTDTLTLTGGGSITLDAGFDSKVTNFESLALTTGGNYNITFTTGYTGFNTINASTLSSSDSLNLDASNLTRALTVTAGAGNDTIKLDSGNDSIYIASINLTSADFIDAGNGIDTLFLTGGGSLTLNSAINLANIESMSLVAGSNYSITLNSGYASITNISASALGAANSINLDASTLTTALTVTAGAGNDTISFGSGNDTVIFALTNLTSSDTVNGGAGTDSIILTGGGTLTLSNSFNSSLLNLESLNVTSGSSYSIILGSGFNSINTFNGSALSGSNGLTLNATANASTLSITGGSGSDTISVAMSNLNSSYWLDGGAGTDILTLSGGGNLTLDSSYSTRLINFETISMANGASYNLTIGSGYTPPTSINASALTGANALTLDASSVTTVLSVTGGSGNDSITLQFSSLSSSYFINGGAGTDTLWLTGGGSNTLTSSFNGQLTLLESLNLASGFNYSLSLGAGYTAITNINASQLGNANALTLNASAMTAAVTVTAGAGNDSITLGGGNDQVLIATTNLTSSDYIDGGSGTDTLTLSGGGSLTLDSSFGGRITNVESLAMTNGASYNLTIGSAYSPPTSINASALTGTNSLTLDGSSNSTILSVTGGSGNDTVTLKLQDLTSFYYINGGAGTDALWLTGGGTKTLINGFNGQLVSIESINLASGFNYFLSLDQSYNAISNINGSQLGVNNTLSLNASASLTSLVITTGSGNDSITLGYGGDNVVVSVTNFKNNTYFIDGGSGIDTLTLTGGGSLRLDSNFSGSLNNIENIALTDGASYNLKIDSSFTPPATINASTLTGTNTLTLDASSTSTVLSVTGGNGNDNVTLQLANLTSSYSINGSAGTDALWLTGGGSLTLTSGFNGRLTLLESLKLASGFDYYILIQADYNALTNFDASQLGSSNSFTLIAPFPSGNLTVTAGAGNDSIATGQGNDQIFINTANLTSADYIQGNPGTDTLTLLGGGTLTLDSSFSGQINGIECMAMTDGASYNITIGSSFIPPASIDASGLTGTNTLTLDASALTGSLTVTAGAGNDTIILGGSNDSIYIATVNLTSSDFIDAGGGTDTLYLTGGGSLTLDPTFTLRNIEGISFVAGGNYNITLNSLYTGPTNFSASALGVSDSINLDASASSAVLSITGGSGNDSITLQFVNFTSSYNINGGAGTDTLWLTGGGTNTLTSSFNGQLTLLESLNLASGFNYSLTLKSGYTALTNINASLLGGSNALTLNASAMSTAVTVTAGAGDDMVTLGAGNDNVAISVSNFSSADYINGGVGTDTLTLFGGGSLTLSSSFTGSLTNVESIAMANGASYNLTIGSSFIPPTSINASALTGTNALTFDASAISTVLSVTGGSGNDSVTLQLANLSSGYFINGGAGTDALWLTGGGSLTLTSGFNTQLTLLESLNLTSGFSYSLTLGSGYTAITNINASQVDSLNTFTLNASAMTTAVTVTTAAGNDSITLGSGNDQIVTTPANLTSGDYIDAGSGTDTLLLTGGGSLTLNSTITLTNIESISLVAGSNYNITLNSGYAGVANIIASALGASNSINFDASTLTTAVTVTAGAGNDTISLGSGNDNVFFTLSNLTSSDSVNGGTGTDTINLTGGGTLTLSNSFNSSLINFESLNVTSGSSYVIILGSGFNAINTFNASTLGGSNSLTFNATANTTPLSITGGSLNDTISVALSNFNSGYLLDGGAGTDTLTLTGGGNLTLDSSFTGRLNNIESISMADGASYNLILGSSFTPPTSINASALTGSNTLTFDASSNNTVLSVTGGSGNDSVTMKFSNLNSAYFVAGGVINGGAGTDVLSLTGGGSTTFTTDFNSKLTLFERLDFVSGFNYSLTVATSYTALRNFNLGLLSNTNSFTLNAFSVTSAFTITAGAGNDSITLGNGNDLIYTTSTNLTSGDFVNTGSGTDTLFLTGGGSLTLDSTITLTNLEVLSLVSGSNYSLILNSGYTGTAAITGSALGASNNINVNASTLTTAVTVTAGAGNDTISLGSGNDAAFFTLSNFTSSDTLNGGAGTDTLNLTGGGTLTLTSGFNSSLVNFELLNVTAGSNYVLVLGSGFNAINAFNASALAAANTLNINAAATATPLSITGGSGADTITLTMTNLNSSYFLNGGAGIDTLTLTGGGNLTLNSGYTGRITNIEVMAIADGASYNLTIGSSFTPPTSINASALTGSNTLTFDASAISTVLSVTGGSGNDSVTLQLANLTTSGLINGGAGTDALWLTGGGSLTLTTGFNGRLTLLESLNLTSGFNYSLTLVSGYSALTNINASLLGSANALTLNASAMTTAVTVTAGAGNDSITLGSGNDAAFIAPANLTTSDFINAGAGSDTLTLINGGNLTLTSGFNSTLTNFEILTMADGANYSITVSNGFTSISNISASALSSSYNLALDASTYATAITVTGGAGNDSVTLGSGTDTVSLGAGNDIFVTSENNFSASDTLAGGAGTDTLLFTNTASITSAELANKTGIDVIQFSADNNTAVISNAFVAASDSASVELANGAYTISSLDTSAVTTPNKIVIGGTGTVTLADGVNNIVYAKAGVDTTILGGTGDDAIYGDSGNDFINGGVGYDYLFGGGGNDTIVYDPADVAGATSVRIDGGVGDDTLKLFTSGTTFDLTTIDNTVIQNIETIDITGTGNNTLKLDLKDVVDLSSTTNTLIVKGNAGDVAQISDYGSWSWSYVGLDATNGQHWTSVTSDAVNSPNPNADIYIDQSLTIYVNGTLFS